MRARFQRDVRKVICPKCEAQMDQACRGDAGEFRVSNHQERLDRWKQLYGVPGELAPWQKRQQAALVARRAVYVQDGSGPDVDPADPVGDARYGRLRAVECPQCHAAAGVRCMGRRGSRIATVCRPRWELTKD